MGKKKKKSITICSQLLSETHLATWERIHYWRLWWRSQRRGSHLSLPSLSYKTVKEIEKGESRPWKVTGKVREGQKSYGKRKKKKKKEKERYWKDIFVSYQKIRFCKSIFFFPLIEGSAWEALRLEFPHFLCLTTLPVLCLHPQPSF